MIKFLYKACCGRQGTWMWHNKLQGMVPKETVYMLLQARGSEVCNVHTCVVGDSKFYKSVGSNNLYWENSCKTRMYRTTV